MIIIMLVQSQKPQILRVHDLQQQQRTKFIANFINALQELLPATSIRKLQVSPISSRILNAVPDIYYTVVTLLCCRRRLGQEYTYVAMHNQQHYEEQGVLLNKKTRVLLAVLQIASRNIGLPLINHILSKQASNDDQYQGVNKFKKSNFLTKIYDWMSKIKIFMRQILGLDEQWLLNAQWLILMIFMLDWNKKYTVLQTLLGIGYIYTYKNDQNNKVSYKVQGYLLLIVFIVKASKQIFSIIKKNHQKISNLAEKEISKPVVQNKSNGNMREGGLCRICYDTMTSHSATKCGHIFCWPCIVRTLQMSPQCPVCRTSCKPQEVIQLKNW